MSKNTRNRILLTAVAALLLVTMAVGGTLAWLVDSTDEVENTFTTAGIDIELTEDLNTDTNDDGVADKWTAKLVPGTSYKKNPIVSVVRPTTDVDVYLFVEFEENGNPSTYLSYTSNLAGDLDWTQGDGTTIPSNVWYRIVTASDNTDCNDDACTVSNPHWHLLQGDSITVRDEDVTDENMATASQATLSYKAWAVQYAKSTDANGNVTPFTPAEAWANRSK